MAKKTEEAPQDPQTEPERPQFRVIYEGIVLSRSNVGDKASATVVGSVAQLSDGRLMARVEGKDIDGAAIYAYEEWEQDPNRRTDFAAQPRRDASGFRHALEALGRTEMLRPTALRLEIDRFKREYPELTVMLGLERHNPPPLFDPGQVCAPTNPNAPFLVDLGRSRALLDRFMSCDFGIYGCDISPPTAEEIWLDSSLPTPRRNVVALHKRSGLVRGHYELPEHLQEAWDRHFKARPQMLPKPGVIEFLCLVRPGGNRSIVRCVFAEPERS
jgi:hypothetical protein